ncbi:MAG: hypothetical protein D4R67_11240 [Bacteroidetes bacterium]|nr:MAG: hypothetical protein D4R67_11240 [Bacteroidota bacterium]
MKTKVVTILIHVVAWVIFLCLPYIFRPKPVMDAGMMEHKVTFMFLRFLTFNIYLISIFYLHAYWMLPRLLLKKRYAGYILLVVVLFIFFLLIREALFVRPNPIGPLHQHEFEIFRPDRIDSMFLFVVIMVISGGIWIIQEWMQAEKRAKQIEAERLAMELSFLRSQINPHFLFNTLNTLYSLTLLKSDHAPEAVMKLSNMMRYITDDSNSERVLLAKEVEYISHYIELQRLRLSRNMTVQANMKGEFQQIEIPPLILIPFVENAFKYGISSHERAGIHITLKVADNQLSFRVSNRIFRERELPQTPGLGINNTRLRLEKIFPEMFSLNIIDNGKVFIVALDIYLA